MNKEVKLDERNTRFWIDLEGEPAVLRYVKVDEELIDFISTHVPEEHRGQDLASNLVKTGLEYARENNMKIIATCGYVKKYIEKHQEYQKLVA